MLRFIYIANRYCIVWQDKTLAKSSIPEGVIWILALSMQYLPKLPNLELKTQHQNILGYLPLDIVLTTHAQVNCTYACPCIRPA
jgi:hypothetical protein